MAGTFRGNPHRVAVAVSGEPYVDPERAGEATPAREQPGGVGYFC
ncbi:hypothetical protein ABZO31_03645 [Streptomyces sp. HUAS MG47]